MYQPGMDQGLARIEYAEKLEYAAQERAARQNRPGPIQTAAPRLALAFAAIVPVAALIVWAVVVH